MVAMFEINIVNFISEKVQKISELDVPYHEYELVQHKNSLGLNDFNFFLIIYFRVRVKIIATIKKNWNCSDT